MSGPSAPRSDRGDSPAPTAVEIEDRLRRVGRYSRVVVAGFGVIVTAFVLAVTVLLPANLESPAAAVEAILQPLIFLGMGLLLLGIGMHLHLLHLNVVRQLPERDATPSDREPD